MMSIFLLLANTINNSGEKITGSELVIHTILSTVFSCVLSLFLCLRLFRIFLAVFSKVSEVVTNLFEVLVAKYMTKAT